jgi:hypothetical protein
MGTEALYLEADAARLLMLPWNAQLTSRDRWSTFAASCFERVYGEAPDEWVIRVADEAAPRSRLAAALPKPLLHSANAESPQRSVRMSVLEGLGQIVQKDPTFDGCVIEIGREGACLLVVVAGQLLRTRVRRFAGDEELAAAARSEWAAAAEDDRKPNLVIGPAEAASRIGAPIAAALGAKRVIALPRPVKQRRSWFGARFDIDFATERARIPLAAWALAAAATLVCCTLAAWLEPVWRLHGELAQQQTDATRLIEAVDDPATRATRSSATAGNDAEASAQANTLMRDLQLPWAQLLDRLEASQVPKVHLVSFEVSRGFSGLQILAEAATLDDLLTYTKRLPGGPIAAARLTHHEWQGDKGPRFLLASIQADLKPSAPR